jgi:hypothetical protein
LERRPVPQFGVAAYSVDGGPASFVNAYSPKTVYQTQNAVISGLNPGSHSLKIEVTSSRNAASSDCYQVVDAFVVQGGTGGISPTQTIGAEACSNALSCMLHHFAHQIDKTEAAIGPYLFGPSGQTYDRSGSNGWGCFEDYAVNPGDISGYHCVTGVAGSYLSWPFNGSLIEVYGRPDAENGFSNIYIDGVFVKTVDWVWGTIDDDLINSYNVFTWQGNPGNHTITIIATGTSSGTQGSLLQIDTLMAFP